MCAHVRCLILLPSTGFRSFISLFVGVQGLSGAGVAILARMDGQWAPKSHLSLPVHRPLAFPWVLSTWAQAIVLQQQVPYPLSHLSALIWERRGVKKSKCCDVIPHDNFIYTRKSPASHRIGRLQCSKAKRVCSWDSGSLQVEAEDPQLNSEAQVSLCYREPASNTKQKPKSI